jgi:6-phosphogluconate dehydrogenase
LLVPAGKPVDDVIDDLLPILDTGDIIIDGGNSFFRDTIRRIEYLNGNGIHFMGMGVSGGEQGARTGPSMMPGGNMVAYDEVKTMLEAVAAKSNGIPCFAYMGKGAAGHFVKMVHNGIEYAMMQMISEVYDLMKRGAGFTNEEMHALFSEWNQGKLQSFLIEITAAVLMNKDAATGSFITDIILDKAGSKGTGKWTTQEALNVQAAIPTIDAAVAARTLSGYKEERIKAAALYPHSKEKSSIPRQTLAEDLQHALLLGFIMAYVQGFDLIEKASQEYDMEIDAGAVLQVWKAGCIIRSGLLAGFEEAYAADPLLSHLLLDKNIADMVQENDSCIRRVINIAVSLKIPVPAFMSAVAYLDAFTTDRLPTNLIQAQRDFFGSHTYERIDLPGVFHTEWEA